jgi:hypothetical protein
MKKMEKIIWYSIEVQKPKNLQKIEWKLITPFEGIHNDKQGIYIEKEDMFFVGFEDSSNEFYYSFAVAYWRAI